jgi:phenylacetate-CoA ligase
VLHQFLTAQAGCPRDRTRGHLDRSEQKGLFPVFETGIRQLRMAWSMLRGTHISPGNLERLIGDARATLRAFGAPGDDVEQLLDGPFADPGMRRHLQDTALRRTVRRAARVSPYYRERLATRGIDPGAVTTQTIENLPLTRKPDLLSRPADFIADGSRPFLSSRSTGTTGQPVTIWISRYEAELWPALAALAGLLRGELREGDSMQVNISSRATAAVHQEVGICRLAGAACHVLGLIPAAESVRNLTGPFQPTLLSTYPSYLAEMAEAAQQMGLGPGDFTLRRIDCGGERLPAALAAAAGRTFGAPVTDLFAMTEVLPVSGRTCSQGHLHHDLNMGLVEVVDPATGLGVAPGELGSVTITPYFPYRECMPLLRYDTRDMVRRLAKDELTCELAGMPATSAIVGKAEQLGQRRPAGTANEKTGAAQVPLPVTVRALPARARAELRELTFTSLEQS